mgnify:CR=1 FL=1
MTPRGARAIAATAYLYLYPLVVQYGEMYRQAVDPASSSYSGGFGEWRRTDHVEVSREGAGGTGGRVLRSTVWLDLRAEPWCYIQPAVPADVVFRSRWIDLCGFVLDERDAAVGGDRRVSLLAASPTPVRDVPDGIEGIVRGESAFVELQTEVRWRDERARPSVPVVFDDVTLEPVSAQRGRPAPAQAPAIAWWPWQEDTEITNEFWSCANFALTLATEHPDDRDVLERIATIGVAPGQSWDPTLLPDGTVDAIEAGMDDALSDLFDAAGAPPTARPARCGRDAMDRDYFGRALDALGRAPSAPGGA